MGKSHYIPFDTYTCLNCGNSFEGIVCNTCGQHPVQEKLTLKALYRSWRKRRRYDSGMLLSTVWQLIIQPGTVISEYLNGKRHRYYNAVNFFLLIGSITAFVTLQFSNFDADESVRSMEGMYASMGIPINTGSAEFGAKYMGWMQSHYNILMMLAVPFMAFTSWLMDRKRGFSFGEHVILHCYSYGMVTLFTLPFLPFFNPFVLDGVFQFAVLGLMTIWYAWVFKGVFQLPTWKALLHAIVWYVLYFVVMMVGIFIVTLVVLLFALLGIFLLKALGVNMKELLAPMLPD